jgi:hypothetical protein
MALTKVQYVGDGTTTRYTVTFPYLNKDHVKATVDGVAVTPVWFSNTEVDLPVAPAAAAVVTLRRQTPRDDRLVTYVDSSTLTAAILDQDSKQLLYISQEVIENEIGEITVDPDGSYNVSGQRVTNVQDPQSATDAATKAYVDALVAGGIDVSFSGDMGGNKIINLATPTNGDEAATKQYVDDNSGVDPFLTDSPTATFPVVSRAYRYRDPSTVIQSDQFVVSGTDTAPCIRIDTFDDITGEGFHFPFLLYARPGHNTGVVPTGSNREAMTVILEPKGSAVNNFFAAIKGETSVFAGGGLAFGLNGYARAYEERVIGGETIAAATPDAQICGAEMNTDARVNLIGKIGMKIVDVSTSTGRGTVLDAGLIIDRQGGGRGYDVGIHLNSNTAITTGIKIDDIQDPNGLGIELNANAPKIGRNGGLGGKLRFDGSTNGYQVVLIDGSLNIHNVADTPQYQLGDDGIKLYGAVKAVGSLSGFEGGRIQFNGTATGDRLTITDGQTVFQDFSGNSKAAFVANGSLELFGSNKAVGSGTNMLGGKVEFTGTTTGYRVSIGDTGVAMQDSSGNFVANFDNQDTRVRIGGSLYKLTNNAGVVNLVAA